MKNDELIIERRIEKIVVPKKGRKEWLDAYFNESRGFAPEEPTLPSVRDFLKKEEDGGLSKIQLIVLELIKKSLNPKRRVLIDVIAKNPGKNHADLLNVEAIRKIGFAKKTLSVELKNLKLLGIIRDDAKNEKTHPKHVFMCNNFELLKKAFLNPR